MSSAYCMTCNEQVLDLSGYCPEGHTIGQDTSPEPWVGHANAAGSSASAPPAPVAQSIAGTSNGNGHEHAAAASQVRTFAPVATDVDQVGGRAVHRAPATGEAADELAAMLASALAGDGPPTDHTPPTAAELDPGGDLDGPRTVGDGADAPAGRSEPTLPWTDADLDEFLASAISEADTAGNTPPTAPSAASDAASSDSDWGDLASLAAELQLDGPMNSAPEEIAPLPPPAPAPEAQLSDQQVDLPPPAPLAAAPAAPAPAALSADAGVDLDALSDQDLAALYESAVGHHLDEADHVPSDPTPPAPEAAAAPVVTVDLANFTARGNPVSRNSAATRRFGRKR